MEKRCISTDGTHLTISYGTDEVTPYINWAYFFHAWGFRPGDAEEAGRKADEARELRQDALRTLRRLKDELSIRCVFRLCRANAQGDDLWIEGVRFPLLRQQTPHPATGACLCLSDFVRPLQSGQADRIGLFASAVTHTCGEDCLESDPYRHLLLHTLADRLAEAATEKLHEYVRKTAWGYAPHEDLPMADLLLEKFQGIRPAVGYPSLPDQSVNFILDRLLQLDSIGISLTENGAMRPHSSTSGLMLAHPAARYFSVGAVGDDQLNDYARRRGMSPEEMRKFIR